MTLTFLPHSNFAVLMDDISFNIACIELEIAQIAQLNQLFERLHLVHMHSHGFYELRHMQMRKNVNNDVSKDSPIESAIFRFYFAWPSHSLKHLVGKKWLNTTFPPC